MAKALDDSLGSSQGAPNAPEGQPQKTNAASTASDSSSMSNPKAGITFASQDKLPKLPIPELEDTCRRYLEALKALQSAREHDETAAAVQEFLKKDGPVLQEKLKRYAVGKPSYIEQFCELRVCHALNDTSIESQLM